MNDFDRDNGTEKKLSKRVISFLLSVLMLATFCVPINVFAEDAPSQTSSSESSSESSATESSTVVESSEVSAESSSESVAESVPEVSSESSEVSTDESAVSSESSQASESSATESSKTENSSSSETSHTEAIRQVELKATTDDKLASVTVKGSSDIIPADGSVKIKKITKKSENKTIEEKLTDEEDKNDKFSFDDFVAFDITIFDKNGKEIEPTDDVTVDIKVDSSMIPEDAEKDSMTIAHLKETDNGIKVEDVIEKDDNSKLKYNENDKLEASFKVDSFSTFTVTWKNSSTTYFSYTFHYVDANGNEIAGAPTSSPSFVSNKTVKFATDSTYVKTLSGYVYNSAHYGSYTGTTITSMTGVYKNNKRSVKFYNNSSQVRSDDYNSSTISANIYFVYNAIQNTVVFDMSDGTGVDSSLTQIVTSQNTTITLPAKPNHYYGNNSSNATKYDFYGWSFSNSNTANTSNSILIYPAGSTLDLSAGNFTNNKATLYAVWGTDGGSNNVGRFYIRYDGQVPFEPAGHSSDLYTSVMIVQNALYFNKHLYNNNAAVLANLKNVPTDAQIKAVYPSYDSTNQQVVWYVTKYQDDGWHIDGTLVEKQKCSLYYNPNCSNWSGTVIPGLQYNCSANVTVNGSYVSSGSTWIQSTVPLSRTGYTFAGWNTKADGSGVSYAIGSTITMPNTAGDVTLYAQWIPSGTSQMTVTKKWVDSNGNQIADANVPFNSIQLDVKQYYYTADKVKKYVSTQTLTLSKNNSWTTNFNGTYDYTFFEVAAERYYDAGGAQVTNTGDWTMGSLVITRDYATASIAMTTINDTSVTITGNGVALIKLSGSSYGMWTPFISQMSANQVNDLKTKCAASLSINISNFSQLSDADMTTNGISILYNDDGSVTLTKATSITGYTGVINFSNKVVKAVLNNTLDTSVMTNITLTKTWEDNGNSTGTRPSSVNFILTNSADSSNTNYSITGSGNTWTKSISVRKYNTNGSLASYTIDESNVAGYDKTIDNSSFTINNKLKLSQLKVTKVISGTELTDDEIAQLEASMTFTVKGGSSDYSIGAGKTYQMSWSKVGNTYVGTCTIPNVNANVKYTVAEENADIFGYTVALDSSKASATTEAGKTAEITLSNVYTKFYGDISISKSITNLSDGDLCTGNFQFEIKNVDTGVCYYLDIKGENTATAKHLPAGKYSVRELSSDSYEYVSGNGIVYLGCSEEGGKLVFKPEITSASAGFANKSNSNGFKDNDARTNVYVSQNGTGVITFKNKDDNSTDDEEN